MNESKLRIIRTCLYTSALVQMLAALYVGFSVYQSISIGGASTLLNGSFIAGILFGLVYPIGFLIATVKSIQGLTEENPYWWIITLFLGLFSLFSWAAPAGVIVLLILVDKRVRTPFIEKLDLQF